MGSFTGFKERNRSAQDISDYQELANDLKDYIESDLNHEDKERLETRLSRTIDLIEDTLLPQTLFDTILFKLGLYNVPQSDLEQIEKNIQDNIEYVEEISQS